MRLAVAPRPRTWVSVLVVALLAAGTDAFAGDAAANARAASGGGGGLAAGLPAPYRAFADFTTKPNPLNVTVQLSPVGAAHAVIGVEGGTLSVSSADGTTFRLDIPAAALVEDTDITMTPVASMAGWSDQPANVSMVQLEPSGLQLMVPATLTLTRAEPVGDGDSGLLAYDGTGDSLRPILGTSAAGGVTIPVRHFSGYGWVWKLLDESYWIKWMRFQQSQAEAQLQAQFAALVGLRRSREMRGLPVGDLNALVAAFIDSWYNVVYEPRMAVYQRSCTDGRAAAAALLSLWRVLQLAAVDVNKVYSQFAAERAAAGRPVEFTFQTWPPNFVRNVTYHCDEEAVKECNRTGDLTRLLTYIRDRTEYFQQSGGPPPEVATDEYLVQLCARYEVRFDATASVHVTSYYPDGTLQVENYEQWRITVTVRLRWHQLSDTNPWIGEVVGQAVPTEKLLASRQRDRNTASSDRGSIDKGWAAWSVCNGSEGPWSPWALRIKSLDFRRHPFDQTTLAFTGARVEFGPASFKQGQLRISCTGNGGQRAAGGGSAAGLLIGGSPPDIGWKAQADGWSLAPNDLHNWKPGTWPMLGVVDWENTNKQLEVDKLVGNTEVVYEEQGHVELVHTPAS